MEMICERCSRAIRQPSPRREIKPVPTRPPITVSCCGQTYELCLCERQSNRRWALGVTLYVLFVVWSVEGEPDLSEVQVLKTLDGPLNPSALLPG